MEDVLSRSRLTAFVTLAAALMSAPLAHAQGTSEAAATALFDEGRRLMGEHKFAEACPKLAESERLAPSGGTLLNLADCYEHTGQTASAWVAWKDVASRANAAGKADVEKRALTRAAALEPALSKLTIAVDTGSDVSGLEVKRDGVAVGHTEFGLPIPVDPGAHVIEATAPKKKAFSVKVDVAPTGDAAGDGYPSVDAVTAPASLGRERAEDRRGRGWRRRPGRGRHRIRVRRGGELEESDGARAAELPHVDALHVQRVEPDE
jgi:hypothetical protein